MKDIHLNLSNFRKKVYQKNFWINQQVAMLIILPPTGYFLFIFLFCLLVLYFYSAMIIFLIHQSEKKMAALHLTQTLQTYYNQWAHEKPIFRLSQSRFASH